ncbi:MAG: hypothetical protein ACRDVZ_03415, partial [Jiangellaceae bacterium]
SQDAYNLPPVPEKIDPDKDDVGAWNPSEVELLVVKGPEAGSANVPDDTQGNPLPDGGCGGEATAALGGFSEDFGLPDGLTGESYERAESDSRVKAAVDEWAACMDRAGYEYESIWEPNNADWPDPAGPEEIAVATADVACKAETNLAGIWLAVETAYQNQLIEENAEKLAELKAWRDNYLHNAAEALGAS